MSQARHVSVEIFDAARNRCGARARKDSWNAAWTPGAAPGAPRPPESCAPPEPRGPIAGTPAAIRRCACTASEIRRCRSAGPFIQAQPSAVRHAIRLDDPGPMRDLGQWAREARSRTTRPPHRYARSPRATGPRTARSMGISYCGPRWQRQHVTAGVFQRLRPRAALHLRRYASQSPRADGRSAIKWCRLASCSTTTPGCSRAAS